MDDPVEVGRRVARYCRTNASYAILGAEGTWSAGGCTLLATALADVLGERAVVRSIGSRRRAADEHSVVDLDGVLIDSDGPHDVGAMLQKMRDEERVPDPRVGPFSLVRAVAAEHIYSEGQRKALATALRRVLGRSVRR